MMFMRVDLPDPDAPMMATKFAVADVHGYTVECADLDRTHVVNLGDVADTDYCIVAFVSVVHIRPAVVG